LSQINKWRFRDIALRAARGLDSPGDMFLGTMTTSAIGGARGAAYDSLRTSRFWQGGMMVSQFELSSRAALCRQLASQDPANRFVWMAEARSWSRLSDDTLLGEDGSKIGLVTRVIFAFGKLSMASRRRYDALDTD
jgi:hypothetical protein